MSAATIAGTAGDLLIIADHASNAVPADVDLAIGTDQLDRHIAFDLGTDRLARCLAQRLRAPAVIAVWSRLVADCNRDPAASDVIPAASDGTSVPGNLALTTAERASRLRHYHDPYHAAISAAIDANRPRMLISLHSFTPQLSSSPARPWQVALLSNRDRRAAESAIRHLTAEGLVVGDNQPYSGTAYGYTTDRHAESIGLPYLAFEVRQDELAADPEAWEVRLARTIDVVQADLFAATGE